MHKYFFSDNLPDVVDRLFYCLMNLRVREIERHLIKLLVFIISQHLIITDFPSNYHSLFQSGLIVWRLGAEIVYLWNLLNVDI